MRFQPVRRSALLPLLVAMFVLPSGTSASAQQAGGLSVTTTVKGLRLTLSLPRQSYPRHALVRLRLTSRNVSSHALYYVENNSNAVDVINGSGRQVYQSLLPLGMNTLVYYKGPGRVARLPSGRSVTAHVYAVLNGRFVRAEMWVGRADSGPWTIVRTPRAVVHLITEAIPDTAITTTPSLSIRVVPSWPVSGKLHYLWQSSCITPDWRAQTGRGWTSTTVSTIAPVFAGGSTPQSTCSGSIVWNGLAGWLNHPVAAFHYSTPAQSVQRSE